MKRPMAQKCDAIVAALGLLSATTTCACDCGLDEHLVRYLQFTDLETTVQGQFLYPEQPEGIAVVGLDSEGPDWDKYYRLSNAPSEFSDEVHLGMGFYLYPPWCEDSVGSDDDLCAHVGMGRLFVGPKKEGEVYHVVHMNGGSQLPIATSIQVKWDEEPYYRGFCDFPEYHSVTVIGNATVTSEHPLSIYFDVEFRDEHDELRHVMTTFSFIDYDEVCQPDN